MPFCSRDVTSNYTVLHDAMNYLKTFLKRLKQAMNYIWGQVYETVKGSFIDHLERLKKPPLRMRVSAQSNVPLNMKETLISYFPAMNFSLSTNCIIGDFTFNF